MIGTRAKGLVQLGLQAQDWGPCADERHSHSEFSAKWRGTVPCPSEPEIAAAALEYKEPVPIAVTAVQARKALTEAGLRETVEAWVQQQPLAVQDDWYYADPFRRDNPTLLSGAAALGLTSEQLDNLFRLAVTM